MPEDLHRAAPKRFWLLHNALKLSANGATAPDEHELAEALRPHGARRQCLKCTSIKRPACGVCSAPRSVKVVAITGGKGGVGKTLTAVNLGAALAGLGRSTMLLDADFGLANVDVLLGMKARLNLEHVVTGQCALEDVILTASSGLRVVPATSGSVSMASLEPRATRGAHRRVQPAARAARRAARRYRRGLERRRHHVQRSRAARRRASFATSRRR